MVQPHNPVSISRASSSLVPPTWTQMCQGSESLDAGEQQNLLQWEMQNPQQDRWNCCVTPTALGTQDSPCSRQRDSLTQQGRGAPSPRTAGGAGLLTQVLLPHSGMLVLGPRQCGNRIRAALQRLSTAAKECERLRRRRGSCQGIPAGLTLPLSSPGKGQSLQFSL